MIPLAFNCFKKCYLYDRTISLIAPKLLKSLSKKKGFDIVVILIIQLRNF